MAEALILSHQTMGVFDREMESSVRQVETKSKLIHTQHEQEHEQGIQTQCWNELPPVVSWRTKK